MGIPRHFIVLTLLAAAAAGCTLPALATPTPTPTPSPSPSPSLTPEPTASPTSTPTPDPTPDAGAMPRFSAGERIGTTLDGLRVRQRPGTTSSVVTGLLPIGSELQVVMGPILVQGTGWFLVTDADPDEPQFEEGWIASGFEPEAFLASIGASPEATPYIASFAQTGSAEYGPVEIGDDDHAIRWIAADPERVRCEFSVLLAAGSAEPVQAIRATIGNGVDPGTLQPGSFAALDVRGQTFVTIESDCAWTLVIVRIPDVPDEPSPSASP